MANDTTVKFRVDISELRKQIQEANRHIRLAKSEFEKSAAGLDDWTKSADGVSSKAEELTKILENQEKILEKLKAQHTLVAEAEGKNSKGAEELEIKINKQEAIVTKARKALEKFNAEFENFTEATDDAGDATEDLRTTTEKLQDAIKDQETELKRLKSQYSDLILEQKDGTDEAKELAGKIKALSSELDENKTALKNAKTATEDLTKVEDAAEDSKDDLRTASEKLKDTIEEQQTELDKLKNKYVDAVLEEGKYSDNAQELATEIGSLSDKLNDNQRELQETENAADDLDNTMRDVETELDPVSGGFTVLKGALADLVADGIRKAIDGFKDLMQAGIDYESAFTSIRKTTDETEEGYKRLDKGIKEMSSEMPQSAADIAEVVASAGQLGVEGVDNLLDFTKVMIMLGDATDMSSDDAASMFARFANITGLDFKNISNLGSTVAALGNNFATTESEIGNMALRLAGAGTQVGMSEAEILAMAAALSSVGIESEAGGSAFSKLMTKIAVEVADNGEHLEQYAKVAGMSVDEFSNAFEKDALGAIQAFLGGLNAMDGNEAIIMLNDMELSEVRLRDAILRSSGAIDNFNDAVNLANISWEENTALQDEAQQRYETTASKIQIMKNQFQNVGSSLLDVFGPAIEEGISFLEKLAEGLEWIVKHSTEITAALAGIGTAIAGLAIAGFIQNIGTIGPAMLAWLKSTKLVTAAQWLLNAALNANPIGLVVIAIASLTAAFMVLWKKSEAFRNFWKGLWKAIQERAITVIEAVVGFFTVAWDKIKAAWGAAKAFFSATWGSIKAVFSAIAQWISDNIFQPIIEFFQPVITFFTEAWQIIKELAEGCWNAIKAIWESVSAWFDAFIITPIKNLFNSLWDSIKEKASAAWTGIKTIWEVVSSWFNNTIIMPVKNFFTGMWDSLKDGASRAWAGIQSVFAPVADWFKEKFQDAWTKVKAVFSVGGKIFDGIKEGITEAFKTVVNAIIRGINKVIAIPFNAINNTLDLIRNVSIAGVKPFENLITRFTVPEIPELAKGGVLKKGQMGLLEGNGTEAVVPLEKNTRWLDEIANRLYNKINRPGQMAPQTVNNNTVNNFNQTNNSPKSLSRLEIYRQSKNLLHMKGV